MSVKKTVFEYLEKNLKSSLDQVVDGLPELKKTSIKKYYYDFKKLKLEGKKDKIASIKQRQNKNARAPKQNSQKGSIRQKVFDLLAINPEAATDELLQKIDGSNRKTIREYRNQWRKMNSQIKTSPTTTELLQDEKKFALEKKAVYKFMMQYPDANLNDLRKLFPHNKKLVTDFRSWKREQPKNVKPVVVKDVVPTRETIQSLKQVIRKQNITIEAQRSKLKEVRSQLVRSSKYSLDGLISFLVRKLFNK